MKKNPSDTRLMIIGLVGIVLVFIIGILSFFDEMKEDVFTPKYVAKFVAKEWADSMEKDFLTGVLLPFKKGWIGSDGTIEFKYYLAVSGHRSKESVKKAAEAFAAFQTQYRDNPVLFISDYQDVLRPVLTGNAKTKGWLETTLRYLEFAGKDELVPGLLLENEEETNECWVKSEIAKKIKENFISSFDKDWQKWIEDSEGSPSVLEQIELAGMVSQINKRISETEKFCSEKNVKTENRWISVFRHIVRQNKIPIHKLAGLDDSGFDRMCKDFAFGTDPESKLVALVEIAEDLRRENRIGTAATVLLNLFVLADSKDGK